MLRRSLGQAYQRVLWANTVSSVGAGVYVAALPLLAVTVTRDPRLISLVAAAEFVPWLVWSLPAGVIVDRYDRAVLMWRSQVAQGLIIAMIAVLVLLHAIDIGLLILLGFLLGSAEVFFSNAAQSVLPELVPADQLPKANGNLQVSLTVGETFAGPPLGSLLFAVSRVLPFALNAGTFFGSAALLSRLPKRQAAATAHAPMRAQIGEGLRYLGQHRLLRVVAILLGASNFASQMGQATLVLLAVNVLHTGVRGYGLLWTASAVGAIAGGMTNPVITRRLGIMPSLIMSLAAFAAAMIGVGLAPSAIVAGACFALNGYFVTMWNIVTVSLRQQIVPPELLGRVNSVYRMIGWGLIPVGAVAGGLVAKEFGLRAPYTLGGIVIAVIGAATVPVLMRARRLRPAGLRTAGYGLLVTDCWLRFAVAAAVIELAAGQSGPAERDDDRDDQPGRGQRHREPGRLRGYFSGRRARRRRTGGWGGADRREQTRRVAWGDHGAAWPGQGGFGQGGQRDGRQGRVGLHAGRGGGPAPRGWGRRVLGRRLPGSRRRRCRLGGLGCGGGRARRRWGGDRDGRPGGRRCPRQHGRDAGCRGERHRGARGRGRHLRHHLDAGRGAQHVHGRDPARRRPVAVRAAGRVRCRARRLRAQRDGHIRGQPVLDRDRHRERGGGAWLDARPHRLDSHAEIGFGQTLHPYALRSRGGVSGSGEHRRCCRDGGHCHDECAHNAHVNRPKRSYGPVVRNYQRV
jgi:MFS family permease